MKKYIIGIKYGDIKTRLVALSVPVCILFGVLFVLAAFITNIMPLFLGGLVCGVIAVAVHQSFDIAEDTVEIPEKSEKIKKEKPEKPEKTKKEKPEKPEKTKEEKPEKPEKTKKEKPEKTKKERPEKPEKTKKEKPEKPTKVKKERPAKVKKEKPAKPEETDREDSTEEIQDILAELGMEENVPLQEENMSVQEEDAGDPADYLDSLDLPEKPEVPDDEEELYAEEYEDTEEALDSRVEDVLDAVFEDTEDIYEEDDEDDPNITEEERKIRKKQNELQKYDKKTIKHYMYKYRVKRDHKTLIIDSWKEKKIHQSPAYIWLDRKNVHFLVIGEEAKEYAVPLAKVTTLKLHKGVACKAKEEYLQFRKPSVINTIFSPYLPSYNETEVNGRMVVSKNLFELGEGIMITAASARVVLEMIQVDFGVDDIVMRDVRYNDFFKQVYKLGVMFREGMLPTKLYQNRINDILQEFADSDVSDRVYSDTLQQMYQHRLITVEYVDYYRQYRERRATREEDTSKFKRKKNTKAKSRK